VSCANSSRNHDQGVRSRERIPEQVIDRPAGALLAGRHEVGIDAQREAGVRVAEVRRQGLDALASVEQRRGVKVTQSMHARRPGRHDAGVRAWPAPDPDYARRVLTEMVELHDLDLSDVDAA
jgi:hypothetical protein